MSVFNTAFFSALPEARVLEIGSKYARLDLSETSTEHNGVEVSNSEVFSKYVDGVIADLDVDYLWGGYLERRAIYKRSPVFRDSQTPERTIHLGIDLWCDSGTPVLAALEGEVHSFQNNDSMGDYGPTIVLKHQFAGQVFHTLYGHLSVNSLQGLWKGKQVKAGEKIGELGDRTVNGDYPPHLHFQIILDMQGKEGDYPGVSSEEELPDLSANCPNPNLLLRLTD